MKKNLIIVVASVLAIAASVAWIYYSQFKAPKFNVPLYRHVGEVLAEQTAQLAGKKQGKLVVITLGPHVSEELDAEYGSDDLDIGYNAAYLLDILRTIDSEEVDIRLNTPVTAGLLAPAQTDKGASTKEDLLCLVMPLRLAS